MKILKIFLNLKKKGREGREGRKNKDRKIVVLGALLWLSGLRSPLPLLCLGSLLSCGFDLWPRNFCMLQVWPKKRNKRKKRITWSSHCGSAVIRLTSIHEDTGSTPGLAQWVGDLALP